MKNIDGVVFVKKREYAFCRIEYFSGELKDIIRKQLAGICYGSAKVNTGRIMYSYKATVQEFLKRYENKTEKIKKGLIGELLTHIIMEHYVWRRVYLFRIEKFLVYKHFIHHPCVE